VLLDLNLPDSEDLETLTAVRRVAETVPVIVLTGVRDRETGMEAFHRGADEYLVKDQISSDLLIRSIYHAVVHKRDERELKRQRDRLEAKT
jgi:PleD family two-component response regulator